MNEKNSVAEAIEDEFIKLLYKLEEKYNIEIDEFGLKRFIDNNQIKYFTGVKFTQYDD